MNYSQIGVRYAKAFYSLAKEKSILEDLYSDIKILADVINLTKEFRSFFFNPVIKPSVKIGVTEKAFKGKLNKLTINFINTLIENGREAFLDDIIRSFLDIYREENKINSVKLVTAKKLDKKTVDELIKMVEKINKSKVEITEEIDEKILGGMILRIDNLQYDASVKSSLDKYKRILLETGI